LDANRATIFFNEGYAMNRTLLMIPALLAGLSLSACDKPTVVNVPAPAAAMPGPAGPAGEAGDQGNTGAQGYTGDKGETGSTGDGTTIILTPEK
jgi:hypothetical protein